MVSSSCCSPVGKDQSPPPHSPPPPPRPPGEGRGEGEGTSQPYTTFKTHIQTRNIPDSALSYTHTHHTTHIHVSPNKYPRKSTFG